MTMTTTRTLMLTAFATLSLAGAAMAQDGPSGPARDYQAAKILAARQVPAATQAAAVQPTGGTPVQSGSSDVTSHDWLLRAYQAGMHNSEQSGSVGSDGNG
jgi:hypothetical protein